jgi:hypothetical protein
VLTLALPKAAVCWPDPSSSDPAQEIIFEDINGICAC